MSKSFIKVYGERHTGTNYLSELIYLNLMVKELYGVIPPKFWLLQKVLSENRLELARDIYFDLTYYRNLGWKHTSVKAAKELKKYSLCHKNISFVTITKNPYSWLLSLYKNPYHQYYSEKPNMDNFLVSPWKTVRRENAPSVLSNPVELWNLKNSSYLQLKENLPTLNIRYEDLIDNPKRILELISETFSLQWKSSQFKNHDESTTQESYKNFDFYRDYYLNERWKEKLTPQLIALINERIDDHLMKKFNYEKLA